MIKQLTGTDEAAGRRCLSGLQVLIKQLTGADQLAEKVLFKRLTVADQLADTC